MLLEISVFGRRNYIFITPSPCMWRGVNLVGGHKQTSITLVFIFRELFFPLLC
jgi:hypothetical protein